jgi:DNA-binding CsgD family transcriptional regulator
MTCILTCKRATRSGMMLSISMRTVDTHRAHIMRKLDLASRAKLVPYAPANGLIGAS